jgi:choice-of-anchor B domain-containing protein
MNSALSATRSPLRIALLSICFLVLLAIVGLKMPQAHDDHKFPPSPLPAEPAAMRATSCVNGMAGPYPCANIDLMALMPFSQLGSTGDTANDVWGWTDTTTGKEYAIVGLSSGTAFVDISNPSAPVFIGKLPTHGSPDDQGRFWRSVKVYQNHAFIVSEASTHGMQVFDLTRLRTASPSTIFSATTHYSGFGPAHTLAVNQQAGFAYAAGSRNSCSAGLHMVDILNPLNPTFAGCVTNDGYTHETQCVIYDGPDTAHVGDEICFNSNEDTLTIVDVSIKSSPQQLSRSPYPQSGYTHQGWLTEDHRFFLLNDELDERNFGINSRTHIWDVSDLEAPQRIGIYEGPTRAIDHNLYIKGQYAYEGNYRAGLRILDISDVGNANLREVAYFDIYPTDDAAQFSAVWSNYPFFASGNVIVGGIEQGLFILRPNITASSVGAPNFKFSAATTSASVSAGQSANYTVTATPENNFGSSVSLSCLGLPTGANCSFSPASITPSGGPVSATVTISTTAREIASLPGWTPSLYVAWLLPMALVAPRQKRKRYVLPLLILAIGALGVLIACGGGGGDDTTPTGTQPGSYTISITATSGQIIRSAPVTLTVH